MATLLFFAGLIVGVNSYTGKPYVLKIPRTYALQAQKTEEEQVHPWLDLSTQLLNDGLVTNKTMGLRERPGYAFGLGSDKWMASRYRGTVEGWSGSTIHWISRSLLQRLPLTDDDEEGKQAEAADDGTNIVISQLDMNFYMTPLVDIPHLRLSIASKASRHEITMDYLPRVELLTSLDYFDKYFSAVEAALYQEIIEGKSKGIEIQGIPDTVLTRMLSSPFALRISVNTNQPNAKELVQGFCTRYVRRWREWVEAATEISTEQQQILCQRDIQLQKLHYEDQKYAFARLMDVNFAPKAAELSAAVMGPALGPVSYYFLGSEQFQDDGRQKEKKSGWLPALPPKEENNTP